MNGSVRAAAPYAFKTVRGRKRHGRGRWSSVVADDVVHHVVMHDVVVDHHVVMRVATARERQYQSRTRHGRQTKPLNHRVFLLRFLGFFQPTSRKSG